MTGDDGPVLVTPTSSYGVKIRTADTTARYFDINIIITEWLGFELCNGDVSGTQVFEV